MKYQLENPNNCSINIDYKNKDNPVKFRYVGDDSAFKLCYNYFRSRFYTFYFAPFCFLSGIFFYAFIVYRELYYRYIFLGGFLFLFATIFYLYPMLFGYIFSKNRFLLKKMPYLWANKTIVKYYVEFKPEDIINNQVEIPLYGNQFLHYQLFDEFKSNIEKIDIIEHPFNKIVKKGLNKRIIKKNDYLWKAVFTFSKKPEHGILCVTFC
jgi:hypothetical protein